MLAGRARRLGVWAEAALAFLAGIATFAVVALAVIALDADVPVLLLALPLGAGVLAVARRPGVAFAVPVAMAAVHAYDWYYLPPTHAHEFPDAENLAGLLVYLALGVLIGQIASRAGRRAAVSDAVRTELADEQAALRRVATQVAQGVSPADVLDTVARELGRLLAVDSTHIGRYEPDATVVGVANWSRDGDHFPVGTRSSVEGSSVTALVHQTGRPARVDHYDGTDGSIAAEVQARGIRASVGAPIVVDGHLWGVAIASSRSGEPPPPETESRIAAFTELVGTAIANAEAQVELSRLADEQAALRRVATLVATGADPADLFAAVTEQVARLFAPVAPSLVPSVIRFDPGPAYVLVGAAAPMLELPMGSRWTAKELYVSTRVRNSGRSARVEEADLDALGGPDAELLRRQGFLHQVGSPIVVEGSLWGAMTINATEPLPPDAGERLEQFTELIATAIANTESRAQAERLAGEQTARRRVAILIAKEAAARDVFARVTEEVANLLGGIETTLWRDEGDGTATMVAGFGSRSELGTRLPTDGDGVIATVLRERRPHLAADIEGRTGPIAERGRALGIRSAVGCPILIGERVWGALGAARRDAEAPFAPGIERRLTHFADLIATAVLNAEARGEVERLAAEQAALRRVATLVAEGSKPATVFDAVAGEMASLLDADQVALNRFEPDDEIIVLAHRGLDVARTPVGSRVSVAGESATAQVRRTGRTARMEGYANAPGPLAELARETGLRSSVSAPIVVEGRLWGLITASWKGEDPPPADTEERMARFAELLDTAIANADTRDQLDASRARLVSADDEARRRVVRDLHDGAQQRLVHTIVTLTLAKQALREDGGKAAPLVSEALEQAQRSNDELRELAHGILPYVLTHGGLPAAVDSVIARMELPVRVDLPGGRFPAEIEASAYFFVAEALTNVAKHARAQRADVRASVGDGTLRVQVRDDGVGGADPAGHGLIGMSDRVSALGGRLDVDSPPGGGTLLTVTLPLSAG